MAAAALSTTRCGDSAGSTLIAIESLLTVGVPDGFTDTDPGRDRNSPGSSRPKPIQPRGTDNFSGRPQAVVATLQISDHSPPVGRLPVHHQQCCPLAGNIPLLRNSAAPHRLWR